MNMANKVSKGNFDKMYPLARYDISVITRSLFQPYFDSNYDPDQVLFVGETWMFENLEPEVLAEGLGWTEGPVWSKDLNALLFSDVNNDRIYKWSQNGGVSVFMEHSGGFDVENMDYKEYERKNEPGSNGLAIHDGYLYICSHYVGRIHRIKIDQINEG